MSAWLASVEKHPPKLRLPALPEGGAVVHVEADAPAVGPGALRQLQAGLARLGRHGGEQAGHVDDLHALVLEDALQIIVLRADAPAHLAGPVVVHPRAAHAIAGIGDVELVAHAPGALLDDLRALKFDVAAAQIALDK